MKSTISFISDVSQPTRSPGLKKEIQWGEREVEDVAKRGLKEGRIGNREMLRI